MNLNVLFDWKFVVALGGTAVAFIVVSKLDASAIKEVSLHMVDAYKELAIAKSGLC